MIVRLIASSLQSAFDEDSDPPLVYVFMVDPRQNYLMLSRAQPIGDGEDWGIYAEVNDQINSGYDQIARCELTRDLIRVTLAKPLGRLENIEAVEVSFTAEHRPNSQFVEHLRQIFTDRKHLLQVAS